MGIRNKGKSMIRMVHSVEDSKGLRRGHPVQVNIPITVDGFTYGASIDGIFNGRPLFGRDAIDVVHLRDDGTPVSVRYSHGENGQLTSVPGRVPLRQNYFRRELESI